MIKAEGFIGSISSIRSSWKVFLARLMAGIFLFGFTFDLRNLLHSDIVNTGFGSSSLL